MDIIPLEHEIVQKCSEIQLNGANFIITKCKKFCCKKQYNDFLIEDEFEEELQYSSTTVKIVEK